MVFCNLCEKEIESGILYGQSSSENSAKPICLVCLRKLLESDGKNIGLKERIEKWLNESGFSFSKMNEPKNYYHFVLKDFGPLNMSVEIFQNNDSPYINIGFLTFLSRDLVYKIYKMSQNEKNKLKEKVDDFLSSLRVDYRTGIRVGYEIISDKGHYGAKFLVKTKASECNKEVFFKIIQIVKETGGKSDSFLNSQLLS